MISPARENLLTWEVIKVIYEEGARFLYPDEDEGLRRVRQAVSRGLAVLGTDGEVATTADFRKLYRTGWDDLVDDIVPHEARRRVAERFRALVF